jgi:hypothetical protein
MNFLREWSIVHWMLPPAPIPVFLQGVAPVYLRVNAGHISLRDISAPKLEFEENGAIVRCHVVAGAIFG